MSSRRGFLTAASGAAIGMFSKRGFREIMTLGPVPAALDHILLGCSELDQGIAFVERHTGVRAEIGGVHPDRGTRNALLALGGQRYLEIIAPDPAQPAVTFYPALQSMVEPRLVAWAVHPGDLDPIAARLREAHVAFDGPTAGSRRKPDGQQLTWRVLALTDDNHGLVPFCIEWSAGSLHPAASSPAGCELVRLIAAAPDPAALARSIRLLGVDLNIQRAVSPQLRARITGPRGTLDLTS